jgi:hypothetical protein
MTSLMFDSDDPSVLMNNLLNGCRVATYADLLSAELVSQFAGRLIVIDRGHGDPMNLAHVVDIESGAYSVDTGAAKIQQWNKEGRGHIAAYVDRADWNAVLTLCLPVKPYMWIATLDGTLDPSGKWPTAVQFNGASTIGIHVDVSIVYDETWVPITAPYSSTAVRNAQGLSNQLTSLAASLASAVKAL